MKILFVVSGTERVAASRYRVYQYLPYLGSQGVECKVFSSISDLATRLAIRSPEFGELTRIAYYAFVFLERSLRFWPIFFSAWRFDVIFLQRATFPIGLGRMLKLCRKKIIFDIDDAIFLPDTPRQDPVTRFKTFIKQGELKDILTISDCVIVENDYIRDHVLQYCPKVYKIPGPIDTERYFVKEKDKDNGEVILGWIGSPATTGYMHILDGVFAEILKRFDNVKIVLIGAGNYEFSDRRVIKKPWNYDSEVAELQDFDIGLMPMPDDQWTRGKLGCKMLQYMAVGVPAVVSHTPTNAELIVNGDNGFLVHSDAEWMQVLADLIGDGVLRADIGIKGRAAVEKQCSVRNNAPKLFQILTEIVGEV